jgi:hypothetical protein
MGDESAPPGEDASLREDQTESNEAVKQVLQEQSNSRERTREVDLLREAATISARDVAALLANGITRHEVVKQQ